MNLIVRGSMKKRYLYTLLFGIPGFFIAGIISLFFFGAFFGVLWIFIFGITHGPPQPKHSLQSYSYLSF